MKTLKQYMNESLVTEAGTPGISNKEDLINLMKSMQDQGIFELKETEGDYSDIRYEMHYKPGLIHWIEFDNDREYLDGYITPDGSKLRNDASEIAKTDWNLFLDSRKAIPYLMKNVTKIIAKEKARAERYRNIYDRNHSGAMYDEYTRAQSRKARWERRLEKYQNMQKYI